MKKLFSILLFSVLPFLVFSQTQKDYEQVMGEEIKFYNNKQVDSLNTLGPFDFLWDSKSLNFCLNDFGHIKSFKFMEIDLTNLDSRKKPYAYFAAVSEKYFWGSKTNALGISIDSNNKLSGIRFLYKSEHTDSMLKKYHFDNENED